MKIILTLATFALAAGQAVCVEVRATDTVGNTSPWTPERCVRRLLPTGR